MMASRVGPKPEERLGEEAGAVQILGRHSGRDVHVR